MIPFTITVETISPTAPGSGEGHAGVIDRDITHDTLGLPYIGARRLKGLLKEAVSEVQEVTAGFDQWRDTNLLAPLAIFGEGGRPDTAPFRLSDAQLKDYAELSQWLKYAVNVANGMHYFHPEAVLAHYTEIRAQTAMDARTGGAQDNTLRNTRMLRPGLRFIASGALEPPDNEWLEKGLRTLWLACHNLRRAGLSRNRGQGRIQVTFACEAMASPLERMPFIAALSGEGRGDL